MKITKPKFCHLCGHEYKENAENPFQCAQCKNKHFVNPAPTVNAVLITSDKKIVLSIRGREPNKGKLDLIGGFVDLNETLEAALIREIHEETGLKKGEHYKEMKYLTSTLCLYPFSQDVQQNISMTFVIKLEESAENAIMPNDDIESARVYTYEEITHIKESDFSLEQWPVVIRQAYDSLGLLPEK